MADDSPPAPLVPDGDMRLLELGHLTSAVCHYLINSFAAVVSSAEMIQIAAADASTIGPESPGHDELIEHAQQIVRVALQSSEVARKLIDYARPRLSLRDQPVDMVKSLRQVMMRFQSGENDGVDWVDQLKELPILVGDSAQIDLMLDLIFANARQAVDPSKGRIIISSGRDNRGRPYFQITDNGVGMPAPVLNRAFEPFFTTRAGRLGIGINMAKSIWLKHRGSIAIQSTLGTGTSVCFSFHSSYATLAKPSS